jgi:hypothetical protein
MFFCGIDIPSTVPRSWSLCCLNLGGAGQQSYCYSPKLIEPIETPMLPIAAIFAALLALYSIRLGTGNRVALRSVRCFVGSGSSFSAVFNENIWLIPKTNICRYSDAFEGDVGAP